ncbi:MAG: FGGY-family carbohydrate kinase, partial [Candidatus Dormibacteraeota bacterium]|nr:FGGY-family carbohydrate kinase [Candidatus Dormibacteraeota bacterium]
MPADVLLAGFDVGTSSAKGGLFDLAGHLVAMAGSGYETYRPRPGWAEQDPEAWWRAVREVLNRLGAEADLGRVAGIGVCSQVNTHVAVDQAGLSVGQAIVWQDQRCADISRELDGRLTEDDRMRLWGRPASLDPSHLATRALWMQRHRARDWERTRWLLSPKDYINLRLTGEVATDVISPVDMVGPDGKYIPGLLELVPGLGEVLPPLRAVRQALGRVTATDAGLPSTCQVVVATMDAWGNRYGSGVTQVGQAMEVAGTSEIIGLLSNMAVPTAGIVSFIPVDGLYFHAGPTQAGGDSLRWAAHATELPVVKAIREAGRAQAGSGGLIFLPYLSGERAPLWDPTAQGTLFGLQAGHGRPELLRAVLEGVAYSARHLLEEMEVAAGRRAEVLRSSGGGSRSDLWCQIKADVLGRPIERVAVSESGVLGAALLAGVGADLLPDLATAATAMVHIERIFEPDPAALGGYQELY